MGLRFKRPSAKRPSAKRPTSRRPNFTPAEKKQLDEITRDIKLINQGVDKSQAIIRHGLKTKNQGSVGIGAGNLKASGHSIESLLDKGNRIARRASNRK